MPLHERSLGALLLLTLGGCSAVVGDLGGVRSDPQACLQGGDTEITRDARFVFAEMQAHSTHPTFLALIGGSTNPAEPDRQILRGRALITPSFAASQYAPMDLLSSDPARCAMAAPPAPLTMDFTVPSFLPADTSNGGPFDIDFWCETNDMPGRQTGMGGDHTWVRPVCDDGNVFFVHNTGFDQPVMAETNGTDLTITVDSARVVAALRGAEALGRVPFVVQITRQDQTVGYIRAILVCDPGPYVLRGILDAGTDHGLEAYFDVGLNGVYDPECDPHCTGMRTAGGSGTTVNFTAPVGMGGDNDFDVTRFCQVPAGFDSAACGPHATAP
ncbi:MAG: hypothetical protein K1X94_07935 [Sandaracinaceae bacterium]|nr:hypothetical protein [Sandaracinaceae bacterium]